MPPSLVERVLAKVEEQPNGCLHFVGGTTTHGYPRIRADRQKHRVNIIVFEAAHGPVPAGHVVDHRCHNADESCRGGDTCPHRRCVRLEHLVAVTQRENILAGKGPTAAHARKTHCPKGHPYSGSNLHIRPCGRRACRACQAARR